MKILILNLITGDNVIGVLKGKPDVVITLINPIKYNMVNGYSMFSRYSPFSNDKEISFNRDSVTTYLNATESASEYYEYMLKYVERYLDPSIEDIIQKGVTMIREALDNDTDSLSAPTPEQMSGDVSVEDFFKGMTKPKKGKLN